VLAFLTSGAGSWDATSEQQIGLYYPGGSNLVSGTLPGKMRQRLVEFHDGSGNIHGVNYSPNHTAGPGLTIRGTATSRPGLWRMNGDTMVFGTSGSGSEAVDRIELSGTGTLRPVGDGTQDLGTSSKKWADIHLGGGLKHTNLQVVGARKTGWTPATGTAARGTFATYSAPNISATPTEAEVQAIADHVQILSQRLKALIDDLHATAGHGLIGT
jgi:hypothetical protein